MATGAYTGFLGGATVEGAVGRAAVGRRCRVGPLTSGYARPGVKSGRRARRSVGWDADRRRRFGCDAEPVVSRPHSRVYGIFMASADPPDDTAEAAMSDLGQTLDAGEVAGRNAAAAAVPLAEVPVYRPRRRSAVWAFVAAFVLASVVAAGTAWLLTR